MERKTIICIVGESGTGKSFIASYLEAKYNAPLVKSRTTRPPRHEGEKGHVFVSENEFDTYYVNDMLAFTDFGGYRYCALVQDLSSTISVYVIDEHGLNYLREQFSDTFNIFTVRVIANEEKKNKKVDGKRKARDKGMFTMDLSEYDFIIYNNYDSLDTYKQVDYIYNQITKSI